MAWDIGAVEYGASPGPVPGPTVPPSTTPGPESGGTDDIAPVSVRQTGSAWFVLGKIYLDSGTEYEAKRQVIHPSYIYEGRVLEWGFVDRSIPVPTGLCQLGDCRIRLADTDRKFRDLLAHQTPRRRFIEMRLVQEGESEAAFDPFATFEIVDAEFPAGSIEITGRDITFSWIDKPIPGLINRTNFTLMDGVDEAFMPIIAGVLDAPSDASPPNPQGVLTLPRMTETRWGLAQHPILYVELCGKLPGDGEFTLIDPADYTVTEEPHTIDDIDYTLSFIDFGVPQDPGLEVRCRIVEGFYTRGAFGTMPAVINSPLTALRNPIDLLINILYATLKSEERIPRFNVDSFAAIREAMETSVDTESPPQPYACDGAIDRPITVRDFLSWWSTSFEVDVFVNRYGEIDLAFTTATDPDRPLFSQGPVFGDATDNSLILINSVRQRLANPTCNRLRYNYTLNYSTDEFAAKSIFDNTADQTALAGSGSPPIPHIEEDTVEFRFVRDPLTADHVAARRMAYLALGSYRIELQLPLPEVIDNVELAKLVGVTTYWGLEVGGYYNHEVKTTGLTYDLDRLILTLRGIVRVPQTVDQGVVVEVTEFTGESYFEMFDLGLGSASTETVFYRSGFYLPDSDLD